jgi:hypothetical protein
VEFLFDVDALLDELGLIVGARAAVGSVGVGSTALGELFGVGIGIAIFFPHSKKQLGI